MPEILKTIARWRVPLGFVCGVVAIWLSRPTGLTLAVGSSVALAGEAVRLWAAGHLIKGREVTRSGPYAFVRHPLYLGSAVIGAGMAIASNRLVVAILIAAYLGATLAAAIRTEEAWMRSTFGDRYDAGRQADGRPRRFSLARAAANREYRAVAGLAIVAALLAIKAAMSNE